MMIEIYQPESRKGRSEDTINYPLFADSYTGIYPHAASQYHARPKAMGGIAMLRIKQGETHLSHAQTIFVTL